MRSLANMFRLCIQFLVMLNLGLITNQGLAAISAFEIDEESTVQYQSNYLPSLLSEISAGGGSDLDPTIDFTQSFKVVKSKALMVHISTHVFYNKPLPTYISIRAPPVF